MSQISAEAFCKSIDLGETRRFVDEHVCEAVRVHSAAIRGAIEMLVARGADRDKIGITPVFSDTSGMSLTCIVTDGKRKVTVRHTYTLENK